MENHLTENQELAAWSGLTYCPFFCSNSKELIQKESDKFKKVVQLCEQNNYSKALKLVDELIEQDPAVSDYHRIKGQIFFEQGDAENAVDALIDAVRLDPENVNALILLGNLHARVYSDAE